MFTGLAFCTGTLFSKHLTDPGSRLRARESPPNLLTSQKTDRSKEEDFSGSFVAQVPAGGVCCLIGLAWAERTKGGGGGAGGLLGSWNLI